MRAIEIENGKSIHLLLDSLTKRHMVYSREHMHTYPIILFSNSDIEEVHQRFRLKDRHEPDY